MSVLVLTVGCVLAALGDSKGMVSEDGSGSVAAGEYVLIRGWKGESENSMSRFLTGLAMLFVAQLLSAVMGLYIEATYSKYGSNYREGLFYTVIATPGRRI